MEIIEFTHLYSKEMGFYLFETIDTSYTWRIEARFQHNRNDIEAEIVIIKDVCSPSARFTQKELADKILFIQNFIQQYLKKH